jgi:hypothetical protein
MNEIANATFSKRLAKVANDFRRMRKEDQEVALRLADIACDELERPINLLRALNEIAEQVCRIRAIDEFKESRGGKDNAD